MFDGNFRKTSEFLDRPEGNLEKKFREILENSSSQTKNSKIHVHIWPILKIEVAIFVIYFLENVTV